MATIAGVREVKIWQTDGSGAGKHELLGLFGPGGWLGLEFGSEVEHITELGFKGPKADERAEERIES